MEIGVDFDYVEGYVSVHMSEGMSVNRTYANEDDRERSSSIADADANGPGKVGEVTFPVRDY